MLPYRYLIMLMGLFATYCGWCYNDMMSIPVDKFESCINLEEEGGATFKED